MFNVMQLLKWKRSHVPQKSFSVLIDVQQIHVRNVFLFCFGLAMTKHFFVSNIICQVDGHRISQDMLDTKCFINSTFTRTSNGILYHDYYQWVSLVLLLLAFVFHYPFRIWSNRISKFMIEITQEIKATDDCVRVFKVIQKSRGNGLYWKTFGLECIYLVQNLLIPIVLNSFFNNAWSQSYWHWKTISLLFPELAICKYDYYSGGAITDGSFRCLLPLNSVYRKVFWVVYGIFPILIVCHLFFLLYRLSVAIRLGKNQINKWWCLKIAIAEAKTWHAKQNLKNQWRNEQSKDSRYVSMEAFVNDAKILDLV